uniref:Geranylgeranyl transferase type-2 subunit alpha n=1 Tax=Polytomella parva TaxID=51329 RepID=A0A7S0V800_9CHLO|mmetsp:Transcript_2701/g.4199  ORF Transcript_2701/g.4199 Transcript_2701/m.4199 type:complete len:462 (+) Transcript_2701:58-1443(+)
MHGRPRSYKHKLQNSDAQKKKVEAIKQGTALVLKCRNLGVYNDVVINASSKLLKVVPEVYTLWNFRREALEPIYKKGGVEAAAANAFELDLTTHCLRENPKSYSTWYHRKWVVLHGLSDLDAEFSLITKALSEDQRNFHAWNYRFFLAGLTRCTARDELAFSRLKVDRDFSNYSAWHYRTLLLPKVYSSSNYFTSIHSSTSTSTNNSKDGNGLEFDGSSPLSVAISGAEQGSQACVLPADVFAEEFDLVHQAFATDAQDQSPWIYYQWLLGNLRSTIEQVGKTKGREGGDGEGDELKTVLASSPLPPIPTREEVRALLEMEADHLQEDLEVRPNSKWPTLMQARVLEMAAEIHFHLFSDPKMSPLDAASSRDPCLTSSSSSSPSLGAPVLSPSPPFIPSPSSPLSASPLDLLSHVRRNYKRLIEMDPMRRGFYADALAAAEAKIGALVAADGVNGIKLGSS